MIVTVEKALHQEMGPGIKRLHYLDKETGAGCVSLGTMTLEPHTSLAEHTHLVEDAMLVLEGEGIFLLDGVEYPVAKGMALLVPAGAPHSIRNNGDKPFSVVYTYPAVGVERFPAGD